MMARGQRAMNSGVRSVKRALALIRVMNTHAVWGLADLALASGLPKTSVFRLLQTLEEEGLVKECRGSRGSYRLDSAVLELGAGLSSASIFGEVCAPVIIAATKRLRWPLSVAVLDDCYMRVVFCGMPYSRLAAKTTTLNRRYWIFTSALGMAYFPFAPPSEQQIILERAIALLTEHGTEWPYTQTQLDQRMRTVRARGYSVRIGSGHDATSAMGIPMETEDELLGSLVCSTYPKSLTETRISELYAELADVRAEILLRWRRRSEGFAPNVKLRD
jgi:IclR family mhp operon transcriptional activator